MPIGTYTIITVSNGTISGNFSAVNLPAGFSLVVNSTTVDLVRISTCFNPAPVITASGPVSFCPGGSVVLTSSAASGNIWSNGATTQSITVNTSGTFTVSNTDNNGCISLPSTALFITVSTEATFYADADSDGFGNPLVTISGNCGSAPPFGYVNDNTDCDDTNTSLYPNVSPGTVNGINPMLVSQNSIFTVTGVGAGTWSSSDPQIATVDPISGVVTGIATGSTTISFTIATCTGTATATFDLTINPNITAGVVSGPPSLCIGATAAFTSTGTPGGVWSSSNPARATVDPVTGLVTGISGGFVNIIYTVGGTESAFASLSVIGSPSQNQIVSSNGFVFCIGETRDFDLAFPNTGVWSSSNTLVATVDPTLGIVTAVSGGVANITFTTSNVCGQSSSTLRQIRVIPVSGTPVITGPVNVCGFVGSGIPVKYVASLPGISIFRWTVPPNVTIVSGQFTDTLTVTFAAGFTAQANKQISCSPTS
ncbi:MAG: Ig-like domain-containing protein [Ferruginibacter sp.]